MATSWQLEWLSPRIRRGDCLQLDPARARYLMGRSRRCDIRLVSPSASREHAELLHGEGGEWVIVPRPGRLVLADGAPLTGAVELCEGLNLMLGADRIRCQTPRADAPARPPPPGSAPAARAAGGRTRAALLSLLVLLVLALGLVLLMRASA